ncbi:MAG: hypothetical protein IT449_18395 [Phycisphaerales bacterium]|nr:hypothetical protein [Phycisphaerales bacterium]
MPKNSTIVVGLVILGSAAAAAAQELQRMEASRAVSVSPLRVAPIDSATGAIGEWIDYGGSHPVDDCGSCDNVCFDAFGLYSQSNCGFDDPCGMGNYRWFYGVSYCAVPVADDMRMVDGCGGKNWERVLTAWYWYCGGSGEESCYIIIRTAEDFGTPCAEKGVTGLNDGLVLDFGSLPCNAGSYFTADVNVCGLGLNLPLPADGEGAFTLIMAKQVEPRIELATCGQFMIWGTPEGARGYTGPSGRSDRDLDLEFEPGECSSSNSGKCPDPFGWMAAFFGEPANCTGQERIKKAVCKLGTGKVVLIGGTPGQDFCVTLDGNRQRCGTLNEEGKGRAKFADLVGRHSVAAEWDCGAAASASFTCQ